jgi:hypothetical protein
LYIPDYAPDAIDVRISELLVATNEAADPLVDPQVKKALGLYREHLNMDVVFVSQFENHRRTFRVVESKPGNRLLQVGQSDPVEQSWCQHVVTGRLPQLMKDAQPYVDSGAAPRVGIRIGTHLSTPILMKNGNVYGTLCCFSHEVEESVDTKDLQRLQALARALAQRLEASTPAAPELQLQPMEPPQRR